MHKKTYSKKKILLFFCLSIMVISSIFATDDKNDESQVQKRKDTLEFGLEDEITTLITTLIKEEDKSLADDIYNVFVKTRNNTMREKAIEYFTVLKDLRLKEYVLEVIEDPYDEKTSTVLLYFKYIAACNITEAAPYIVSLLESETEDYYDAAITTIGAIGSSNEAVFLAGLLKEDLSTIRKQNLMKALGQLKAVETWDALVEIIDDSDQNTYVRMYAAEAIGSMELEESIDVLIDLFEEKDPNLRTYALKGLAFYNNEKVTTVIIEGFRDNHYKVRMEAADIAKKWKLKEAIPSLLYRAKNDSESAVKYACYDAIAAINITEGNDFLVSIVTDEKSSDTSRAKAAGAILLNNDSKSVDEVITVVKKIAADTKKTALRYAIGKEFVKYKNSKYEIVCEIFLGSKDASTQGIGLDIWNKNQYSSLKPLVENIANAEKSSGIKNKAKLYLENSN